LRSTVTDLEILANLALYHAERIPAAVYYRLFERTRDVAALDSAIAYEKKATDAWRKIVSSAGDYYDYNLRMGVSVAGLCGHWRDELIKLEEGLQNLEQQRNVAPGETMIRKSPAFPLKPVPGFDQLFRVKLIAADSITAGSSVSIKLSVTAPAGIRWIRLKYRAVNQQLSYDSMPMVPTAKANEFHAEIPASAIDPAFDFMYYIELMDRQGNGRIFPNLNRETPYRIIHLIREKD
jgi:hypothetical protein